MKKIKINLLVLCSFLLLIAAGCSSEDEPRTEIPFVTVDVEFNLQDLRYQELHTNGWIYMNGGVRGLIIIKDSNNRYLAFERTCPYHPQESCAQVEVHSSGFYMIDDCCGSRFDKAGNVTTGPAQQPLLQYTTYQNGNYLIIRN
ncbi:hypothetical protein [Cesiribacter sp. SM1]|uniref:hypothetical protein n=1 Tax=Cesiribacter sp. SM1 TaxID=2861196 RepID=UPI001CD5CC00|nr:hypothetical protein [Cesiribacter sp. SM1]